HGQAQAHGAGRRRSQRDLGGRSGLPCGGPRLRLFRRREPFCSPAQPLPLGGRRDRRDGLLADPFRLGFQRGAGGPSPQDPAPGARPGAGALGGGPGRAWFGAAAVRRQPCHTAGNRPARVPFGGCRGALAHPVEARPSGRLTPGPGRAFASWSSLVRSEANEKLILALPKGRILKEAAPVLAAANIEPEPAFADPDSRLLRFTTNHPDLDIIRVRSFDVATFVAFGAAHLGIAGSDVLMEFDYPEIYAPIDLGIGKCRLAVAEPAEMAGSDDPRRWSHVRIATKYPE